VLAAAGIRFARHGSEPEVPYAVGGGVACEPGADHPLLIPTTGDARPTWTLENLQRAGAMARDGRIAIIQFHGVPDGEHPWVNTPRENFEARMAWLHRGGFKVIALRDLATYIDEKALPTDPLAIMECRKAATAPNPSASPPATAKPRRPVGQALSPPSANCGTPSRLPTEVERVDPNAPYEKSQAFDKRP